MSRNDNQLADLYQLLALRAAYAPVAARDEALLALLRRLNDHIACLQVVSQNAID